MIRWRLPAVGPVSQVEFGMERRGKRLLQLLNLLETGALNCNPRHRVSGYFYLKVGQPLPLLVTGPVVYRRLVRAGCLAFSSRLSKGIMVVAKVRIFLLLGRFRFPADP